MIKKTLLKFLAVLTVCSTGLIFAQTEEQSGTVWDESIAISNPQFYLVKAREYYKTAQDKYAEGDYDLSAEYAGKAREAADNYRRAVKVSSQIELAKARIKYAEELIATAKGMKATDEELLPSTTKLAEAVAYNTAKDYDLAVNSAEESINLTKDLINSLKDRYKDDPNLAGKFWKSYKVRYLPERRDCLWRISEYDFIYNDPWKWPIIWKENKEMIIDPDLIYPDQVFRIPFLEKQTGAK